MPGTALYVLCIAMPGRPPSGADILLAGGVEGSWGEVGGLGLLPYLTGRSGGSAATVVVVVVEGSCSWEGLAPLPGLGSLKLVKTACGEVWWVSLLAVVPGIVPANWGRQNKIYVSILCSPGNYAKSPLQFQLSSK